MNASNRTTLAALAASTLLATSAFAKPGDLDPSFGTGGKKTIHMFEDDIATSVAIQPDGKIIVAGHSGTGTDDDFTVARLNPDGTIDTAFGVNGTNAEGFGGLDLANAMVLQPDGKFVIAGVTGTSGNFASNDFALKRFKADGFADLTFGVSGSVKTPIGTLADIANAAAIDSAGRILAAGSSGTGSGNVFALVRYTSAGVPDSTFGNGGKVTTPIGSNDIGHSVAVQADGKIVVAGESFTGSNFDFAVVRYTSAGVLDTTFSNDGKVTTPIGSGNDTALSVAIQADGRIVLAGFARNATDNDIALARYTSAGVLDTSFGNSGKVITPIGSDFDTGFSVAIQADGRIVVAGLSSNGTNNDFALVRYTSAGVLDASFGNGGKVTTPIGSGQDIARSVAIQADGRIVVAGFSNNGTDDDFAIARYKARIQPDGRVGLNDAVPVGNDRYNRTGARQTQNARIRRGKKMSVFVGIENDGHDNDSFTVRGTAGNRHFKVKYLRGSRNVTGPLKRGTLTTGTLAPGEVYLIKTQIKAKTRLKRERRTFSIIPTSAADPAAKDKVLIKARSQ